MREIPEDVRQDAEAALMQANVKAHMLGEPTDPIECIGLAILAERDRWTDGLASWRPIETAPKDGTVVDLWTQFGRVTDCSWAYHHYLNGRPIAPAGWFNASQDPEMRLVPTHWMLPPDAPDV